MQSPEGWASTVDPCRPIVQSTQEDQETHARSIVSPRTKTICMVRDAFVLDLSYLYLLALRLVAVHRSVSRETGLFLLKLISRDHPNAPGCGDAAGRILYEPGIDGDPGSGGFP